MLENASNQEEDNHDGEYAPPTGLTPSDDSWKEEERQRIQQENLQVCAGCRMLRKEHDEQNTARQPLNEHEKYIPAYDRFLLFPLINRYQEGYNQQEHRTLYGRKDKVSFYDLDTWRNSHSTFLYQRTIYAICIDLCPVKVV